MSFSKAGVTDLTSGVNAAQDDATQALSDAAAAQGTANAALITANNAQTDATQALSDITALDGRVTTVENDVAALQSAGFGSISMTGTGGGAPDPASAAGVGSTAIGSGASARTRDTAIGYMAIVAADGSVALGANTTVNSMNSIAVGADSLVEANAVGGTAIGQNARVLSGATGSIALGQNSVASAPGTVSFGSPGNVRRLTNVAPGIDDTDAVNMSQLRQITNNQTAEIGRLDGRIDDLEGVLDDVGALTSAFSALVPNARAKGDTQVSLGLGNYSSANAMAAGVFHYLNNNILLNAGFSTAFDNNETASRAGITVGW